MAVVEMSSILRFGLATNVAIFRVAVVLNYGVTIAIIIIGSIVAASTTVVAADRNRIVSSSTTTTAAPIDSCYIHQKMLPTAFLGAPLMTGIQFQNYNDWRRRGRRHPLLLEPKRTTAFDSFEILGGWTTTITTTTTKSRQRTTVARSGKKYDNDDYDYDGPISSQNNNKNLRPIVSPEFGSLRMLLVAASQLNLTHVVVEYPPLPWLSTLFSARTQPRATKSSAAAAIVLSNVTLQVHPSQFLLITGDSMAGKSTLLQVISLLKPTKGTTKTKNQDETSLVLSSRSPEFAGTIHGHVELSSCGSRPTTIKAERAVAVANGCLLPFPVYLDVSKDNPKYHDFEYWNTKLPSVCDGWSARCRVIAQTMLSRYTIYKNKAATTPSLLLNQCQVLVETLLPLFMDVEAHSDSDRRGSYQTSTTRSWSQSHLYRMRLFEAAMESMLRNIAPTMAVPSSNDCNDAAQPIPPPEEIKSETKESFSMSLLSSAHCYYFPAPLLLLDEWLDRETTSVIQTVQQTLETLVQETGAIVLAVTHKPERWKSSPPAMTKTTTTSSSHHNPSSARIQRRIHLSRGKIIRTDSSF